MTDAENLLGATIRAQEILEGVAEMSGGTLGTPKVPCIDRLLTEILTLWKSDHTMMVCEHVAANPWQPGYVMAWEPTLLVCAECTNNVLPRPDRDRICDGCAVDIPLTDYVYKIMHRSGPITLVAGLCEACYHKE